MKTTKRLAIALVLMMIATITFTATTAAATNYRSYYSPERSEATYLVEIQNITPGQYLTPPNWAAHDRGLHVFRNGRAPSPGVAAVAELGGVGVLEAELTAAIDDTGSGISGVGEGPAGPIAPGDSRAFEITTDADRFSLVSMLICTNDGFAGIDSTRLPTRDGASKKLNVRAYDAGVELNTERRADLVPAPFCGPGDGTAVDQPEIDGFGRINRHRTLRGVGDLPNSFDWRGPVAKVVITRIASPTTYTVTATNITGGQYLTPPNWAAHSNRVDVFQNGEAASPGVAAVAELGGVGVLQAELAAAVDAQGLGVSGVGDGPAGPIAPGDSRTFSFETEESRLSIVSMLICTNDGFAGLDSRGLPQWEGSSRTYYLRAYDAGVELNTELRKDLVPAPFCGPGDGTAVDQPEIEGFGQINRHPSLQGVGDLPDSFDWRGPVMKVTITNNG